MIKKISYNWVPNCNLLWALKMSCGRDRNGQKDAEGAPGRVQMDARDHKKSKLQLGTKL